MLFKYNKLALLLIPKSAAQSTVPFSQLDTFYSSIPDVNNTDAGTVLSEQELPIGVLNSLVKAKRVAYSSTHPNGQQTPTTATIFTPTSPWRGLGSRPAALLAPGTQGAGDQCALSKLLTIGKMAGLLQQLRCMLLCSRCKYSRRFCQRSSRRFAFYRPRFRRFTFVRSLRICNCRYVRGASKD
ncbi:hypothetical protein FRC0480_02037 [Corynebacterium diphtheriae]|nr:hypothetical protein FRC0480_02037 [Corynebacterium diphtheriae]